MLDTVIKEDPVKIKNVLHIVKDFAKSELSRLNNPGLGKKNIPVGRADDSGKMLMQRSIKWLGPQPPVLKSREISKEEVSVTLLSHWSRKSKQSIEACRSKLEKVNGSAVLAVSKLLDSDKQLYTCQIPGVMVMTEHNLLSDFPERISSLMVRAISEDPDLGSRLFESDGLMKTPILIVQGEPQVLAEDTLEHVSSSVSFYPYVDVQKTSGRALLTLYIKDQNKSESAIVSGLIKGLNRAVQFADDNLPDASRSLIQTYLRQ